MQKIELVLKLVGRNEQVVFSPWLEAIKQEMVMITTVAIVRQSGEVHC